MGQKAAALSWAHSPLTHLRNTGESLSQLLGGPRPACLSVPSSQPVWIFSLNRHHSLFRVTPDSLCFPATFSSSWASFLLVPIIPRTHISQWPSLPTLPAFRAWALGGEAQLSFWDFPSRSSRKSELGEGKPDSWLLSSY